MDDCIVLQDISKSFGGREVLSRINLSVSEGCALVIEGPSGSGKTTLLRLIAGLEIPDSGEVWLKGTLASAVGYGLAPFQRGLGFVFQEAALWPHMNVGQNIMFGLHGWSPSAARKRMLELLEAMELKGLEKARPTEISGGQVKRVALARTLAPQPPILLMDEPLTHLDSRLKEQILDYLQSQIKPTLSALVYVTHDPAEGAALADRTVSMAGGCLLE